MSNNPINVSFSITDQLLCDSVTAAMNKHNVEVLASTQEYKSFGLVTGMLKGLMVTHAKLVATMCNQRN